MRNKKRITAGDIILLAIILNACVCLYVKTENNPVLVQVLLCIVMDAVAAICLFNIETLFRVPLDIYRDRAMVWELIKNDFQARFAGSYLGTFWAFFQPVITIVQPSLHFVFDGRSGSLVLFF